MANIPTEFKGVTAVAKANVYFDGKVVSHTILFPDGSKKTLGLIYPGKFHFGTDQAERMEIVDGSCSMKLDGQSAVSTATGTLVTTSAAPANSVTAQEPAPQPKPEAPPPSAPSVAAPVAAAVTAPVAVAVAAPVAATVAALVVPPGKGSLSTVRSAPGRRIFVDERTVGETPSAVLVACGVHRVRVGSRGATTTVDVPCGGEVIVSDR